MLRRRLRQKQEIFKIAFLLFLQLFPKCVCVCLQVRAPSKESATAFIFIQDPRLMCDLLNCFFRLNTNTQK